MERIRRILHYLANLEWTEKKQHDCIFCDREKLRDVIYEVCVTVNPYYPVFQGNGGSG